MKMCRAENEALNDTTQLVQCPHQSDAHWNEVNNVTIWSDPTGLTLINWFDSHRKVAMVTWKSVGP
jgi:hypothetical protein